MYFRDPLYELADLSTCFIDFILSYPSFIQLLLFSVISWDLFTRINVTILHSFQCHTALHLMIRLNLSIFLCFPISQCCEKWWENWHWRFFVYLFDIFSSVLSCKWNCWVDVFPHCPLYQIFPEWTEWWY